MKVLLLSANTGEGHNSSTRALLNTMQERGIESEMVDVLSIASKKASNIVSKAYIDSTTTNNAIVFSKIYSFAQWVSENLNHGRTSPIYLANKVYRDKLRAFIDKGKYDAVIAVHLFAAEGLTAVKRNKKLHIPSFFIMTDYTIHAFLAETDLDHYIIAHKDLVSVFAKQGIPAENIYPLGIPIDSQQFTHRVKKHIAREQVIDLVRSDYEKWKQQKHDADIAEEAYEKQIDNNLDGKWFLLMTGSMGFGNMIDLLQEFAKKISDNDRLICICGRNNKLRNKIENMYAWDNRVMPIGFTDQVPLIMDACDVVLSKPGGVTTTETFVKNIPLVHTNPIPGIETENAVFCHKHNMSFFATSTKEQVDMALKLSVDEEMRNAMIASQRQNSNPEACHMIIDMVEQAIKEKDEQQS